MGKFRFLLSILAIPLSILACSSDEDSSNQAPATGGTGGATTDATTDVEADTTLDAPSDSIADQQAEAPADVATQDVVEASDAPQETDIDADPDAQVDRPCTLLGQECEPGEKCSPEGKDDALVCRPDGDKSLGNACGENGFDDCLSGLACVEYSSKLSTCRPLCIDTASCPQPTAQSCEPWFGPAGAVAGVCLGDLCSPPSTGCKADERCTVLSVASRAVTACVPAGAVKVGGDCTVDECEPGAMCVHAGGKYVCRSFCHGGNDCNDDDLHCVWPWGDDVAFGLCRSGCDPVRQKGCDDNEGCYYMDPETGSTDCWLAGGLLPGADCSNMSLCQPGFDCVLEPGSSPFKYYCRAYCDDYTPCAAGTCTTTQATAALKFCMP
ncbi:MAG TPA: hypothetical protein PLJ27_16405 [Polyangiaceae bacterium]|nr:hypothetical protein [Polyangiaceae bacterium]HNZ24649.1 hypothetical protein [Polyangiaceae bacterium]HOD23218.1 hypothetical protein [Polyangiaceae bacterium]HOE51690.1 hypothetical protein [Polyangiaceae bacterium]HOH02667.1 hypothetical protein [Polyangiaceae bacterium]